MASRRSRTPVAWGRWTADGVDATTTLVGRVLQAVWLDVFVAGDTTVVFDRPRTDLPAVAQLAVEAGRRKTGERVSAVVENERSRPGYLMLALKLAATVAETDYAQFASNEWLDKVQLAGPRRVLRVMRQIYWDTAKGVEVERPADYQTLRMICDVEGAPEIKISVEVMCREMLLAVQGVAVNPDHHWASGGVRVINPVTKDAMPVVVDEDTEDDTVRPLYPGHVGLDRILPLHHPVILTDGTIRHALPQLNNLHLSEVVYHGVLGDTKPTTVFPFVVETVRVNNQVVSQTQLPLLMPVVAPWYVQAMLALPGVAENITYTKEHDHYHTSVGAAVCVVLENETREVNRLYRGLKASVPVVSSPKTIGNRAMPVHLKEWVGALSPPEALAKRLQASLGMTYAWVVKDLQRAVLLLPTDGVVDLTRISIEEHTARLATVVAVVEFVQARLETPTDGYDEATVTRADRYAVGAVERHAHALEQARMAGSVEQMKQALDRTVGVFTEGYLSVVAVENGARRRDVLRVVLASLLRSLANALRFLYPHLAQQIERLVEPVEALEHCESARDEHDDGRLMCEYAAMAGGIRVPQRAADSRLLVLGTDSLSSYEREVMRRVARVETRFVDYPWPGQYTVAEMEVGSVKKWRVRLVERPWRERDMV